MTANRDFKRLVRARMRKTGEAYTAARQVLLRKRPSGVQPAAAAAPRAPVAPVAPPDYARLAGISDTSVKARTGCNWERWVWALDRVKASNWPHRRIVEYVHTKYKTSDWWSEGVTVGYERIKGLRAIGQRLNGTFEATKSRVMNLPAGTIYRAFHDAKSRAAWLPGMDVEIRTATRNRSLRFTWPDDTSVQVYLTARGPKKCQVAIQHAKLPDRETAQRLKTYWAERLDALAG